MLVQEITSHSISNRFRKKYRIMNSEKTVSSEPLLVLVTYPANPETGKGASSFAESLVEEELVACVNILDNIRSVFEWKGEVEQESENLLFVKTDQKAYPELESFIQDNHPYDVPEIIGFSIDKGLSNYLQWISSTIHA